MSSREEERELLEKKYPCLEEDPKGTIGVLLSDEIRYYAIEFKLIDPFKEEHLKPAAYELTLGDECVIGGEVKRLINQPGKNSVTIPPFEVIVIKTAERLNLPRFLIARWNIRVSWAYAGLVWVGGPQVDPGWIGHLFCPIYNLSDQPVTLRLGDQIAVMDFVKTTPFSKGESKEYPRPPKRVVIDDYNQFKSALYTEARKRIDEIDNRVKSADARFNASLGITFTILAIIIAALSMLVTLSKDVEVTFPWWLHIHSAVSIIALALAIAAFARTSPRKVSTLDGGGRRLNRASVLLVLGLVAAAIVVWAVAQKISW